MSKAEIMATRYGEMLDMIACLAIAEGRAEPKQKPRVYTFDEALALR